jgi:hypothetical protein
MSLNFKCNGTNSDTRSCRISEVAWQVRLMGLSKLKRTEIKLTEF